MIHAEMVKLVAVRLRMKGMNEKVWLAKKAKLPLPA
jgi:hypothetical protein